MQHPSQDKKQIFFRRIYLLSFKHEASKFNTPFAIDDHFISSLDLTAPHKKRGRIIFRDSSYQIEVIKLETLLVVSSTSVRGKV